MEIKDADKVYVSLGTQDAKMDYNEELLKERRILKRRVKMLEAELKDVKDKLLWIEERIWNGKDSMKNEKEDNDTECESNEEITDNKSRKRKRNGEMEEQKTNKKMRTIEKIFERISNGIENEEGRDNEQQTNTKSLAEQTTEIINGYSILKGEETLLKLKWYNYAESFQRRIMEEMERNLSISEQTTRNKIYKEIQEAKRLSEEEYTRLRKMTSRAERFYRVIETIGGRDRIKYLSEISLDAIEKLTKQELEVLYQKISTKGNVEENERIHEISGN